MNNKIRFGVDTMLEKASSYHAQRIALVCNAASLTSQGLHSRFALQKAGFNIVKLFAPEHGLDSTGADGAYINHQKDNVLNVPIISLYSEKLAPAEEDLSDIDVLFIDLPDIGARFYTYLWTMTYVLESCERHHKPVVLLDRPNPMAHNLNLAEGPFLNSKCVSFIGRYNMPITHHCTLAELAQYFKAIYFPELKLEIVAMKGWDRTQNQGYPFFPTSPAIQKRDTIYTYAGACLFEGLNIHEGRGTDFPFAQFGAPWIDAVLLHEQVKKRLTEAHIEEVHYVAKESIYSGEVCNGLRIIPWKPKTFQPVDYFIRLIQIIYELFGDKLTERAYKTHVNPSGSSHLDKLLGIPQAFEFLKNNRINTKEGIEQWVRDISPYLIYT